MSNIVEVKARGAEVLAVTFKDNQKMVSLAYYVAKENGCDIDKPKNLVKSVTVE